jgi:hypothetical protein
MLAKSLRKNKKLRVLGIQFNCFGDAGYPVTQQLPLHCSQVPYLANTLGLSSLCTAMCQNNTLEALDLSYCRILGKPNSKGSMRLFPPEKYSAEMSNTPSLFCVLSEPPFSEIIVEGFE